MSKTFRDRKSDPCNKELLKKLKAKKEKTKTDQHIREDQKVAVIFRNTETEKQLLRI